jgi:hypothetical protein
VCGALVSEAPKAQLFVGYFQGGEIKKFERFSLFFGSGDAYTLPKLDSSFHLLVARRRDKSSIGRYREL